MERIPYLNMIQTLDQVVHFLRVGLHIVQLIRAE